MFFPYRVDVPMARMPWMNWILIGSTVVISIALFTPLGEWEQSARSAAILTSLGLATDPPAPDGILRYFMLFPGHFHFTQLVGNLFTHGGLLHLLGNMWFLWVFGNAINAKLGQWQFLALYLGIGIVESLVWLLIGPNEPAIGASGAIMGIVGAFLILYPLNDVSCLFTLGWFIRPIQFSSGWLIAMYVAFDIWGLVGSKTSNVAYLAHVAGFLTGASVAAYMAYKGLLETDNCERSLLQVWGFLPDNATEEVGAGWRGEKMGTSKNQPAWMEAAEARKKLPPRPRDQGPIPLD